MFMYEIMHACNFHFDFEGKLPDIAGAEKMKRTLTHN